MLKSLQAALQPKFFLPSLTIGLVTGLQHAVITLAFAFIIFSGDLAPYRSIGITVFFLGVIVQSLIVAIGSSLPGMITTVQDGPSAIMTVIVAALVAAMPNADPEVKLYTVLAYIILANVLTGIVFWLLGRFQLGRLVSYIPYPVVGGFLAGAGLMLLLGALQVMSGESISLFTLHRLFKPGIWLYWLPGVAFGLILFVLVMKVRHYLVLPLILASAVGLFYAVLALNGVSVAQAAQTGWLLQGVPPGQALFNFWSPLGFSRVDWPALLGQSVSLIAYTVVSLLGLLLNVTGLELATSQEIDLNQDLKNNGWANILSGALGSIAGYPVLSATALAYRLGARLRLNGVFAALVFAVLLALGGGALSFTPNLLLGGLLFFIGIDFLFTWVYQARVNMPPLEYAIIIVIMLLMNTLGFLPGVGAGLALAVAMFVFQYSRTQAIRHTLSGVNYPSTVERSRQHTQILKLQGDWLLILELQGFLFFGAANQILAAVRARLDETPGAPLPQYILLNFRLVTGMDSSAMFSFTKLKRTLEARGVGLALTGVAPQERRRLEKVLPSDQAQYFPDLDQGMAWCEDQIITAANLSSESVSVLEQIAAAIPVPADLALLQQRLRLHTYQAGETIIRQGSQQAGLYIIESGLAVVELASTDGSRLRLRKLGPGMFFGEMGLYTGEIASASVLAEQPCQVYEILEQDLRQLERDAPTVAAALHRFVTVYLSERLAKLTTTVQALLK